MSIENRDHSTGLRAGLKDGMHLVARYKGQEYTAVVIETGKGVRYRLAAAAAVVAAGAGLGALVATQGDGPGPAQSRPPTEIAQVTPPPPARPIVIPPKNV